MKSARDWLRKPASTVNRPSRCPCGGRFRRVEAHRRCSRIWSETWPLARKANGR